MTLEGANELATAAEAAGLPLAGLLETLLGDLLLAAPKAAAPTQTPTVANQYASPGPAPSGTLVGQRGPSVTCFVEACTTSIGMLALQPFTGGGNQLSGEDALKLQWPSDDEAASEGLEVLG